ncbi:MAG: osmotically-inducible protein OsmY [Pseudohongiellaceae bacterium]|jgi:osmotically-inducible protein OsmY
MTVSSRVLFSSLLVLAFVALPARRAVGDAPEDAVLRQRLQAVLQGQHGPGGDLRRISRDELIREAGRPSDLAISQQASAALSEALGDHLAGLMVSCNDGVVSLRGRVAEAADLYRASDLCRALEGVRGVDNTLTTLSGQRVVKSAKQPTVASEPETFSFVSADRWGGAGVSLEVTRSVVTVQGTVNGEGARQWVRGRLGSVRGVRAIRDQLEVQSDSAPGNRRLAAIVHWKFTVSEELRDVADDLEVLARSGVVHLSGVLATAEQRQLAEALAVSTSGVLVVSSTLTLAVPPAPRSSSGSRRLATLPR